MTQEMARQHSAPHGDPLTYAMSYALTRRGEQSDDAQRDDVIERFLSTSRSYLGLD